jgi:hypothetical protein
MVRLADEAGHERRLRKLQSPYGCGKFAAIDVDVWIRRFSLLCQSDWSRLCDSWFDRMICLIVICPHFAVTSFSLLSLSTFWLSSWSIGRPTPSRATS